MKRIIFALAALTASCGAFAQNYKVSVPLTEDEEGAMAYLVNYDNGNKIDSVLVEDAKAEFTGTIASPAIVRLTIDGKRAAQFILEPGDINVNVAERSTTGGKLNALQAEIQKQATEIGMRYRAAKTEAQRAEIYAEYTAFMNRAMEENLDNPLGYSIFLEQAYEMAPDQVEEYVKKYPSLGKYERVQKLLKANRAKAATQPGAKFVDFEIEYDGQKHRLSDVVGKGDYVLVDFWASWCGPCIRQTAVLKDIYKEYKDQGLKVLGVAVWDEPQNTLEAIKKHELPWESWLNGQTIPTDAYGISGIPCIILFGPDGTILSRDKQDDALRADVAKALKK